LKVIAEINPWLTPAAIFAVLCYLLWTALSNRGHHQIKDKRLYWLGVVGMTLGLVIVDFSQLAALTTTLGHLWTLVRVDTGRRLRSNHS